MHQKLEISAILNINGLFNNKLKQKYFTMKYIAVLCTKTKIFFKKRYEYNFNLEVNIIN